MANIAARKKLSALYDRGRAVRFGPQGSRIADNGRFAEDDPISEDEVEIWVAPPNPHQKEMSLREAQASRARSLLRVKKDETSEEYLTTMAFLTDMDQETLVYYVLETGADARTQAAIREVLAEKEWENIDELRDAMAQFEESGADVDDPEYKSLLDADRRYGEQVSKAAEALLESAKDALMLLGRQELERRGIERRCELVGSQAFISEYERQMKFYSVREPDNHSTLFFSKPAELAEQDELIQTAISDALHQFINEGSEAKNSQGVAPGSEWSELPVTAETSEASTPKTASA